MDPHTARAAAFEAAAAALEGFEPALAIELRCGCLNLNPGEPFFVVRAQDITAPGTVDRWIGMNEGTAPVLKLNAARAVRDAMLRYSGPRKNAD